jgi:hypothetical protein
MPLLILAGCATTTASVGTDAAACSAFEPIRWSKVVQKGHGRDHPAGQGAKCGLDGDLRIKPFD